MNKWFKISLGAFAGIIVLNLFLSLTGYSGNSNQGYYLNQGNQNYIGMNYYLMPMHMNGMMGRHMGMRR